jgi:hypothetical protein
MSQMARIPVAEGKGPSRWILQLNYFDGEPETGGKRMLEFWLGKHYQLRVLGELVALRKPRRGSSDKHHEVTVVPEELPRGYYVDELVIIWDPVGHNGYTELDFVSSCHQAIIDRSRRDGVRIGSCAFCGTAIVRSNPRTGAEEWLNGESPWTPRDDLERVIRL